METTIYTEIGTLEDVRLTGNVLYERGDNRSDGYYSLDKHSVRWNKELYWIKENKTIAYWIENNYDELNEHFCTRHLNNQIKKQEEIRPMTTNSLMQKLLYSSYELNRDEGLTHEQLLSIGLGNDQFKEKYDNQLKEKQ